jgi:hypothetical protein
VTPRAKWALRGGKEFDRLLAQITQLVTSLEVLLPSVEQVRELNVTQLVNAADEAGLQALQKAARPVDEQVYEAVRRAEPLAGHNYIQRSKTRDNALTFVGDEYSDEVLNPFPVVEQEHDLHTDTRIAHRDNTIGALDAGGHSVTMVGSRYGGKSIFEIAIASRRSVGS